MEQNTNKQIEILEHRIDHLTHQLRQQEKMAELGQLSAGIAHEIQNPLNFVINFSKMSESLIRDLSDTLADLADAQEEAERAELADELADIMDDLKGNMQKIQEHGNRAISIIRNILLQSRGKDDEFLPTDVCHLVHEYVWLSYHAMRANDKSFNISINEQYPEQMPQLMVIPQDLCRAVLNVINNACYTVRERSQKEGESYKPSIDVSIALIGEKLEISMSDNGMGMSEEIQRKLFNTSFTTKPIGSGTGLGMQITWDIIINKHKGSIRVTSQEGVGSTFVFSIPARIVK